MLLQNNLINSLSTIDNSDFNYWLFLLLIFFLILLSAFLSGSEVAIFGLSNTQKETLVNEEQNKNSQRIIKLIADPKKLLATILIGNNLVNVAIVIVSSLMMNHIFFEDIQINLRIYYRQNYEFLGQEYRNSGDK